MKSCRRNAQPDLSCAAPGRQLYEADRHGLKLYNTPRALGEAVVKEHRRILRDCLNKSKLVLRYSRASSNLVTATIQLELGPHRQSPHHSLNELNNCGSIVFQMDCVID